MILRSGFWWLIPDQERNISGDGSVVPERYRKDGASTACGSIRRYFRGLGTFFCFPVEAAVKVADALYRMDSIRLENALSILPPAEHKAFLNRNTVDLVVLYDSASTSFPKPGAEPTAPGRLFSIIFENEFRKSLARSPVLLVGGYQAWREEVERRKRRDGAGAGYVAVGKGPPPVISYVLLVVSRVSLIVLQGQETERRFRVARDEGSAAGYRSVPVVGVFKKYHGQCESHVDITGPANGWQFNPPYPQSMVGLGQSYNGQPLIPHSSASATYRSQPSAYSSSPYASAAPTPPPLASTSPGPLSRKRSDYVDQHNKPYSGYQGHAARASMDYPQIHHPSIPQPPPAAATSSSERQESRPRADRSASIISFDGLSRLPESDDMMYWNDAALGISGLKNLGK
jgi:ubiquitin carboxyl-terminal hydrolase 8